MSARVSSQPRTPTVLAGVALRLRSDQRLLSLARGGNSAAFDVLLARYRPRLLRFCAAMDPGSAGETKLVVERVAATARRAMLTGCQPDAVRAWLYCIACEELNERPDRTPSNLPPPGDQPPSASGSDRRSHLVASIACLAERERAALLLRELDRLPYAEIAEILQTTVPDVEALLVRARVGLAEMAEP